jgi:hypothetical protein
MLVDSFAGLWKGLVRLSTSLFLEDVVWFDGRAIRGDDVLFAMVTLPEGCVDVSSAGIDIFPTYRVLQCICERDLNVFDGVYDRNWGGESGSDILRPSSVS